MEAAQAVEAVAFDRSQRAAQAGRASRGRGRVGASPTRLRWRCGSRRGGRSGGWGGRRSSPPSCPPRTPNSARGGCRRGRRCCSRGRPRCCAGRTAPRSTSSWRRGSRGGVIGGSRARPARRPTGSTRTPPSHRARVAETRAARQHPPGAGHDGAAVGGAAGRPGGGLLRRPRPRRRHHRRGPATPADAGRSWPTPSSNASPDRPPPPAVPVEIELLMTDTSAARPPGTPGREEPALIPGYGPIPAGTARELALRRRRPRRRVAAAAVPPSRHRAAGRDGDAKPRVHRQPAPLPAPTRPDLPHPVLRRPHPARRPRPPPRPTADPPP